jgi:hypothetical protein
VNARSPGARSSSGSENPMPLLGVVGASRESAQLRPGVAATHILDDGGD